ncbi:MAG: hypothetical protein Q8O90_06505 [Elusimicrobiota bacterium]|nr:hypothetical protein [Elusimicrobiota bacterium]
MKTYITFAVLAFCFVSCKKKQPENVPVPKAEPAAQTAAAVSTAPVFSQNPLAAPGNYLKTTVGHVKEAKDAKALFEKTAKDGFKNLDLNNTGGN